MKALVHKRSLAIKLRKQGLSYNEILKEIKVAKSTISLWLKDTPLTSNEKLVLKDRLHGNISRGRIKASLALRERRIVREQETALIARDEFQSFSSEALFHFGVALYWAEGAKNSGTVMFINSDIAMVQIILAWIEKYTDYTRQDLRYRLYIHKVYEHEECEAIWAKALGVSLNNFTKTSYKPSNKGVKQKFNYKGCIRVEVPKSIQLLLKIKVWANLMVEYHAKQ